MIAKTWPEPYLQPDRTKDCGFYTAAYIARCLGYPETTADQVKVWREQTSKHEAYFVENEIPAEVRRFWDVKDDETERRKYWLGPHMQEWVTSWLADGWIAHLNVHRIPNMGHAVALLEARDGGMLMDPIYGHVTEPWSWLLGPGPRDGRDDWPGKAPDGREFYGCTYVEGWYRRRESQ